MVPDSPTILQSLVDLKSNQGEYSEAIKYLEKIIELTPENKESGLKLFQLYIQEGNMDYAHELLENLTKYYPSDIDLLYARANFQHLSQDWPNLLNTYHSIYLIDTKIHYISKL